MIWRFTGPRTLSEHSERRTQRWVASSLFLLAPYFLYEAGDRLIISGTCPHARVLAVALTASSVVLDAAARLSELRLGRRLDSSATSGEGVQNLLCAAQALAALIAVIATGAGITVIDPLAAVLIGGIAAREGLELWRRGVRLPHHPRAQHDIRRELSGRLLPRLMRLPLG